MMFFEVIRPASSSASASASLLAAIKSVNKRMVDGLYVSCVTIVFVLVLVLVLVICVLSMILNNSLWLSTRFCIACDVSDLYWISVVGTEHVVNGDNAKPEPHGVMSWLGNGIGVCCW